VKERKEERKLGILSMYKMHTSLVIVNPRSVGNLVDEVGLVF